MKRIILTISTFFIILLFSAEAREITIVKKGKPGQTRFNHVVEKHDNGGWFSDAESKIFCSGDGAASSNWSFSPDRNDDMQTAKGSLIAFQDLIDLAENSIASGETHGSKVSDITIDGECWHREVKWQAQEELGGFRTEITCTIEAHDK